MKLRSEEQIRSGWANDKPLVSILCITFNQEKFIADAIRGFLLQKTSFPFEIIIHDDASTDKTPLIIQSYVAKYPQIIKPIFQKENQYSKGKKCTEIAFRSSKGSFLAICEGDDYWTDEQKLQLQIDHMVSFPDTSLVFHGVDYIDASNGQVLKTHRNDITSRYFSMEELILGGGQCIGTQTIVARRDVYENLPEFFYKSPAGDYPLTLNARLKGNVFYLDQIMAKYRVNNPYSTMGKLKKFDFGKTIVHATGISRMLDEFDEYSGRKYHKTVKRKRSIEVAKVFRRNSRRASVKVKLHYYKRIFSYLTMFHKFFLLFFFLSFIPNTKKAMRQVAK